MSEPKETTVPVGCFVGLLVIAACLSITLLATRREEAPAKAELVADHDGAQVWRIREPSFLRYDYRYYTVRDGKVEWEKR